MRLHFEDRKFILSDCPEGFQPSSSSWVYNSANNTYQTKNIEAAHAYKRHGKGKVQILFNKLMLQPMPRPSVAPLVPSGLTLKDFQRDDGVPFILGQNKTYLAHQPGLGKSAQFISAVNTAGGNALVMVPSYLKINWAREITKWSYNDFPTIQIIPETAKADTVNWSADYVICPHSMLSKPWVVQGILKNKFKFKGVDEAQNFKMAGANRTTSLFGGFNGKVYSPGLIFDCDHAVFMSGTPLLSKPIELYPIIAGACPEVIDFMSYTDFGFRYCGAWQDVRGSWQFTGFSREAELRARITKKFMQIKKKADVLKDFPEKSRSVLVMDRDPRSAEAVELDRELIRSFDPGAVNRPRSLGQYAKLHHINGRAKIGWVADFVSVLLRNNPDEKIILYGYHVDVVQGLAARLKAFKPSVIIGGMTDDERIKIEDHFQNGPGRLICGNLNAMNLGLTLTAASRVIFAEYSTLPKENEQAEDRAHRIGQESFVYAQYIVLPGSLDEVRLRSFFKRDTGINKII